MKLKRRRDNRLVSIEVTKQSDTKREAERYYVEWKSKLVLKYGNPTRKNQEYKDNEVMLTNWEFPSGSMIAVNFQPDRTSLLSPPGKYVTYLVFRSPEFEKMMFVPLQNKLIKDM